MYPSAVHGRCFGPIVFLQGQYRLQPRLHLQQLDSSEAVLAVTSTDQHLGRLREKSSRRMHRLG
jgi:hypothetical protein